MFGLKLSTGKKILVISTILMKGYINLDFISRVFVGEDC